MSSRQILSQLSHLKRRYTTCSRRWATECPTSARDFDVTMLAYFTASCATIRMPFFKVIYSHSLVWMTMCHSALPTQARTMTSQICPTHEKGESSVFRWVHVFICQFGFCLLWCLGMDSFSDVVLQWFPCFDFGVCPSLFRCSFSISVCIVYIYMMMWYTCTWIYTFDETRVRTSRRLRVGGCWPSQGL